jgi:hypothetical protein
MRWSWLRIEKTIPKCNIRFFMKLEGTGNDMTENTCKKRCKCINTLKILLKTISYCQIINGDKNYIVA